MGVFRRVLNWVKAYNQAFDDFNARVESWNLASDIRLKATLRRSWRETKISYQALSHRWARRSRVAYGWLRDQVARSSTRKHWKIILPLMIVTPLVVYLVTLTPKLWTWWKGVDIQLPDTPEMNWVGVLGIPATILLVMAIRLGWFKKLSLPNVRTSGFKINLGSLVSNVLKLAIAVGVFVYLPIVIPYGIQMLARQDYVQKVEAREVMSEARAEELRAAIVLPERDTAFVIIAERGWGETYKVREGYCVSTRPVRPNESYDYIYQGGVKHVRPDRFTEKFGSSLWFSVRAVGGPTTDVAVWYYQAPPSGECKLPKRSRA